MTLRQLAAVFDMFFAKRAKYLRFKFNKNSKQSFAILQNIVLYNNKIKKSFYTKIQRGYKNKNSQNFAKWAAIRQAFISCITD